MKTNICIIIFRGYLNFYIFNRARLPDSHSYKTRMCPRTMRKHAPSVTGISFSFFFFVPLNTANTHTHTNLTKLNTCFYCPVHSNLVSSLYTYILYCTTRAYNRSVTDEKFNVEIRPIVYHRRLCEIIFVYYPFGGHVVEFENIVLRFVYSTHARDTSRKRPIRAAIVSHLKVN